MRFKNLTILVFIIVQTSIDAYESYPECLETIEGCPPTTDSPTPDSPVDTWRQDYCYSREGVATMLLFLLFPPFLMVGIVLWTCVTALICDIFFDVDDIDHLCYDLIGLIISFVAIQQLATLHICTYTDALVWNWRVQNMNLFFVIEFTLLSVVMAYGSTEWKHLKCVRSLSPLTDPNINIWRELNLETPEINLKIESIREDEKKMPCSYKAEVSIPYSYWWVGDKPSKEGDSRELRSRSQTYLKTITENKLTFVSLRHTTEAADEFTSSFIEQAKTEHHKLNTHPRSLPPHLSRNQPGGNGYYPKDHPSADHFCKVSVDLNSMNNYFCKRLTFKPENMKLPLFCRPWFFWLFTVLPFPFFNGVLLRVFIRKFYSVEIEKQIVEYVQILPEIVDSGAVPVPVMDITKGYQVTQSVMDLIEQKHGSNIFSGKVEQA